MPPPQEPGQRLRRARERLGLRYRDVEEASQRIANQRGSHEFLVGLSRLADIENKGTVPSVYRMYSLCAIYGLDFVNVLQWYGVDLEQLATDSSRLALERTRLVEFYPPERTQVEIPFDPEEGFDFRRTSYLTRNVQRWGKLPIALLNGLDLRRYRYGFIGTDDWSMYPLLAPGSFVQIDDTRKRVAKDGWTYEQERPIYFLEHRDGYRCGWCTEKGGTLIVQPHHTSSAVPEVFRHPGEAEIIGQVIGVAMRLDLAKRRHIRS